MRQDGTTILFGLPGVRVREVHQGGEPGVLPDASPETTEVIPSSCTKVSAEPVSTDTLG